MMTFSEVDIRWWGVVGALFLHFAGMVFHHFYCGNVVGALKIVVRLQKMWCVMMMFQHGALVWVYQLPREKVLVPMLGFHVIVWDMLRLNRQK